MPAILLANKVASRADKRAAKAGPSLLAASHRLPEAALPEPQAEQAVQPHDHSRARAEQAATLRREVLPLQAAADQVAAVVRRVRPVQPERPEPPARAAAR